MDKYVLYESLCEMMNQQYKQKNIAYGDSFSRTYKKYGQISALIRMNDKFNRIDALIQGAENKVNDESLKDTLIDLASYCLMTVIEMEMRENETNK